jgi:phosphatidylglycerol:prolipoprotein diacylglycerol transferase
MLAIPFPMIDPVIFHIYGPFAVRWYSLSYVAGILLGWWWLTRLNRLSPPAFTQKAMDDIVIWAILGVVIGGRFGYVLFYKPMEYLAHPAKIFAMWEGGMSFHGGLLGVIVATYLLARRNKIQFWPMIDLLACVTPIGLLLGRIANFINGELYGRTTDVAWAMVFPSSPYERHPSQLYEAALEGLLLLIIINLCVRSARIRQHPGRLSGIFLIGYGSFRAFVEFFREPDQHIGYILEYFTMGQMLCIPMVAFGLYLLTRGAQKRTKPYAEPHA